MSSSVSSRQGEAPLAVDVPAIIPVDARPPDPPDPGKFVSQQPNVWDKKVSSLLMLKPPLSKKTLETVCDFEDRGNRDFTYKVRNTEWENETDHFNAMWFFLRNTMTANQWRLFERNTAQFNKETLREFLILKSEMYDGRMAFELDNSPPTAMVDQVWSIGEARTPFFEAATAKRNDLKAMSSSTTDQESAPADAEAAAMVAKEKLDLANNLEQATKELNWWGTLALTISGNKIIVLPFNVSKADLDEWSRLIRKFMSQKFELTVSQQTTGASATEKVELTFKELVRDHDHILLCSHIETSEKSLIRAEAYPSHFSEASEMNLVNQTRPGILPKSFEEKGRSLGIAFRRYDFICTTKGQDTPKPYAIAHGTVPSYMKIISQCSHCSHCNTMKHTRFVCPIAICSQCRVNHQSRTCKEYKALGFAYLAPLGSTKRPRPQDSPPQERAIPMTPTPSTSKASTQQVTFSVPSSHSAPIHNDSDQSTWQVVSQLSSRRTALPEPPINRQRNIFEVLPPVVDEDDEMSEADTPTATVCDEYSQESPLQASALPRTPTKNSSSRPQVGNVDSSVIKTSTTRKILKPMARKVNSSSSHIRGIVQEQANQPPPQEIQAGTPAATISARDQRAHNRAVARDHFFSQEIFDATRDALDKEFLNPGGAENSYREPAEPVPPDIVDESMEESMDSPPQVQMGLPDHTLEVVSHESTTNIGMNFQSQTTGGGLVVLSAQLPDLVSVELRMENH